MDQFMCYEYIEYNEVLSANND